MMVGLLQLVFIVSFFFFTQHLLADVCETHCRCDVTNGILNCSNNKVTSVIFNTTFNFDNNFTVIDLCHNQITSLESFYVYASIPIVSLHLCDCGLEDIGTILSYTEKLQILNLSHNKLTLLSMQIFGNATSLLLLDISHNMIEKIMSRIFRQLNSLQQLRLSYNKIVHLESDAFSGLDNLKYLDLANNYISDLSQDVMTSLHSLENFRICRNFLKIIKPYTFSKQVKLEILDLSQNTIEFIHDDSFHNNSTSDKFKLDVLLLYDNKLAQLPFSLQYLSSLTFVDLSNNLFTNIDSSMFIGLNRLEKLYINDMAKLVTIKQHAFSNLSSLRVLHVSNCPKLVIIEAPQFSANQNLSEINLSSNRLQLLDEQLFDNSTLQCAINISINPWLCTCNMSWITKLPLVHGDILCFLPMMVFNKTLSAALHLLNCMNRNSSKIDVNVIAAIFASFNGLLIVIVFLFCLRWMCQSSSAGYRRRGSRPKRRLTRAQLQRLEKINKEWSQSFSEKTHDLEGSCSESDSRNLKHVRFA